MLSKLLGMLKNPAEPDNARPPEFLAVMSQELRTPLNAIVGFAELLTSPQSENLSEDDRIAHLRTIVESGRHLQSLINDVLDATRIEKGTLRLVEQEADAAELVEIAVKMCRDSAEKADVNIIARLTDGIEIRGDATRLRQVLINLIANAVKFSAAGSEVHIDLARRSGGGLAIQVRDSGIGIEPQDLARIFEPFVQAEGGVSRRFGGIGLGLTISRRLALLHGGDIEMESRPGTGTTATFVLPAERIRYSAAFNAPEVACAA